MPKFCRAMLAAALVLFAVVGGSGLARADINNSTGTNTQSGDNRGTGNQGGASKSGDAVGGQVTGVVSSGRTSVDAKNTSSNSDVTSGDARGGNTASTFTGLNVNDGPATIGGGAADITGSIGFNLQDGSNRSTYSQTSNATTGDGVAGQVIGAVTAAGGSSSIVAANTSDNNSVQTGDADASNAFAAFTGQNVSEPGPLTVTADLINSCLGDTCDNAQSGNNRTTARQNSTASTGDGVAGQVIGAVSAGRSSIDANNTSSNNDVRTGDSTTNNAIASFVGLDGPGSNGAPVVISADVTGSCTDSCDNLQDGNNTATFNQTSSATSGDGVAGEVIGAVTSAGGSSSIVAANTSTNNDVTTGDASSFNDHAAFVGQNEGDSVLAVAADISGSCLPGGEGCGNVQSGNNRLTSSQTATSATGDGVAGQVLGVVSAGAASLDATNRSDDNSVLTGDSRATNDASSFVGLNVADNGTRIGALPTDVSGVFTENLQDGSNRRTVNQAADATSGDGVAGQVSGVVTSAGGSASVVLANTSTTIDATSGDTRFDNSDNGFVGQNDSAGALTVV